MPTIDEVINTQRPAGPSGVAARAPVPLVIIVGADKGGVGKTMVARVLDDYLQRQRVARQVFDCEFPAGDLRRFVPAAQVINIQSVDDQMRAFDSVQGVTVVDVRAGLLSSTLRSLNDVGLLDDMRAGTLHLALLHVLGQSVASLTEISEVVESLGTGSSYFPVKNLMNEFGFQEWENDPRFAEQLQLAEPMTITIPHMADRAATEVQKVGVGFEKFGHDPAHSRMLRGYVLNWTQQVYRELDRVGLGKLVKAAF